MPIILNQKVHTFEYDDIIGEQYHYPRQYWSYIKPGEVFVYYHPAEKQDRHQYYFGLGRIGNVQEDLARPDHRYAEILDYIPFAALVPFKDQGKYLEEKAGVGTQFFQSVRSISTNTLNRILERAAMELDIFHNFHVLSELQSADHVLAAFNDRYRDLRPETYRKLVSQIDRPTSISKALKEKLGYECQICGLEGFRKKSGGRYAEVHHLLPLHELIPGSLITENILVVCANCHRKLHYGDVQLTVENVATLRITINGTEYRVQRNII